MSTVLLDPSTKLLSIISIPDRARIVMDGRWLKVNFGTSYIAPLKD